MFGKNAKKSTVLLRPSSKIYFNARKINVFSYQVLFLGYVRALRSTLRSASSAVAYYCERLEKGKQLKYSATAVYST